MYQKIKTILIIILAILVCFLSSQFIINKKNKEETNSVKMQTTNTNVEMEQAKLEEKIETSKSFIEEIKTLDTILFGKTNGEYEISHDRTPEGSKWTEWLVNSDITLNITYSAIYGMDKEYVNYYVNTKGDVCIDYDINFIEVDSIDIKNITFSENTSFLGIKYSKEDLLALRKIAKDNIRKELLDENKHDEISLKIDEYFYQEAKIFGIDHLILNGVNISID